MSFTVLTRLLLLALSLLVGSRITAADAPGKVASQDPIIQAAGIDAGLCIVLNPTDVAQLISLSNSGRMLVHGLCMDDASRDLLRAQVTQQGLYGLVSVATWEGQPLLPYASRLANLVIADLDALGAKAPASAELERIMAPDGVLYLRNKGVWNATRPKRPAGLDSWGHFDHGPDGNPVSLDTVNGPVRQQQWVANTMPIMLSGNPAGYDPGAGLRIAGRYAVLDINQPGPVTKDKKAPQNWALQARDASNGLPLWTVPRSFDVARKRWSLVADDDTVYAYLQAGDDLVAINASTGMTLRSFPDTKPVRTDGKLGLAGPEGETACVRVIQDRVIVASNGILRCFDKQTANLLWSFSRDGQVVLAPVVDSARQRVYALLAQRQAERNFQGRWLSNKQVSALAAFDLTTGKVAWECTEVASIDIPGAKPTRRAPGQIIPCGDQIAVFGAAAISGGERPFTGSVDAASGKLLFADDAPFKKEYNAAGYNALYRDGMIWFAGAFTHLWRYDPRTGKTDQVLSYGWNQRCTRFTATPKWFLFGQSAWYDKDFAGEQVTVARSGCAIGNVPANGLTYFTPNACRCITMVRGFHAMTAEAVPAPMADTERLTKESKAMPASSAPADKLPAGPIAEDWTKAPLAALTTPAVAVGDLQLISVIQQHRIEARRGETLVWSASADARISSPPLVVGDTVLYGSHDGCVYAVSASDGSRRFRYMVAPSRRMIVSNAQLESAWPVYGLALMDGKVIASAGTHPGIGGGVAVVALDPQTGATAWRKILAQRSNPVLAGGGKGTLISSHTFINSTPRVAEGLIALGDGTSSSFSFSPDESTEAIGTRLSMPPAKKK